MTHRAKCERTDTTRRLLALAAAVAVSAPSQADPSAMFVQYELLHGGGRAEHTLSLVWTPPPGTPAAAEPLAAADLKLPLFTTAAGRNALFNAAPADDGDENAGGFVNAVLTVLVIGATVASVAASVEKKTKDILDHVDLPPLPPLPPPAGGG